MTLSYDFVFLALVRLALENGNPTTARERRAVSFERRRCLPHPFRRRLSLAAGHVTDYVACCAAMLTYHKLLDDRADERGGSRARAILLTPAIRHTYRRAMRRYPVLAEEISQAMVAFSRVESQERDSADRPAAAFGEVLALLFSHGLEGNQRTVARHVGFHIGKWLYLADATDDHGEDVRRGRFNPLRCLYGDEMLSETHKQALYVAMIAELMRADEALALLDYDDEMCGTELRALLSHMTTIALPQTTRALTRGYYHTKSKKCGKASATVADHNGEEDRA